MKTIKDYWLVPVMVLLVAVFAFAIYQAPTYKTNLVEYKEEYYKCIDNLPAGPESTVYNDWDEVMEECQWLATKLSTHCSNC